MSHATHSGPPGTIWYDGCPECEKRAASLPDSLGDLDALNAIRAWRRMRSWRWGDGHPDFEWPNGVVPSACDEKLYKHLYAMGVYLERAAGMKPAEIEARMIAQVEQVNQRAANLGLSARVDLEDL